MDSEFNVEYIELNLSNYDDEDVAQLNEWAIQAYKRIEELEQEVRDLIADNY